MDEDFIVFDRRTRPVPKSATLTVQRKGTLSMNKNAYEALGKPKAVELQYSPSKKIIRLRPTDESQTHAYPIRQQSSGSATWLIAGQAFTSHFGIPTDEPRRYEVQFQDGMMIIDLNGPYVRPTTPRLAKDERADGAT